MTALLRKEERALLYYVAAYLAVGVLTLYLGEPELNTAYDLALASGTTLPFWWFVMFLSMGTMAAFISISVYWRLAGFKCDPYLMPITAALTASGLVFLFRLRPEYAERQFAWLLIGLLALVVITTILRNLDWLAEYKYLYVAAGVLLLILPVFFGQEQYGARSWLNIGVFQLQTSEFVKILLVLFLASFLAENRRMLSAASNEILWVNIPAIREWAPGSHVGNFPGYPGLSKGPRDSLDLLFHLFGHGLCCNCRMFYIITGLGLFLLGGTAAYHLYGHVQARVDIWLDPGLDGRERVSNCSVFICPWFRRLVWLGIRSRYP
ncbi:hypothetical protein N752_14540 [Desulforamulus aquiferis]|nr:FtsW/RodA/SpoVE family cell cycle protein [Desulforamulus aquiferis]RYD04588.1 hypothetical protein N752_14540 [Desulforamulus aquiferis]